MRIKSKKHEGLNEDMQNLLSYLGELIDEGEDVGYSELKDLYEWLEKIMVVHYDIFTN